MSNEKDLNKIELNIDGEIKEFKRGYVPGSLLLKALQFKAKFERLSRNASKDLKKSEPELTDAEHDSEVMNVLLVDSNYVGDASEVISASFNGQFSAEEFISGTEAKDLFTRCEQYVASAINGVSAVEEETENLSEESPKEENKTGEKS